MKKKTTKKRRPGRPSKKPEDKKIQVYAGMKDPKQVEKLGGKEKVKNLLSNLFDLHLSKIN